MDNFKACCSFAGRQFYKLMLCFQILPSVFSIAGREENCCIVTYASRCTHPHRVLKFNRFINYSSPQNILCRRVSFSARLLQIETFKPTSVGKKGCISLFSLSLSRYKSERESLTDAKTLLFCLVFCSSAF